MGVNNKQRRAAKRKKAQQRGRPKEPWGAFVAEVTPEQARAELLQVCRCISEDASTAGPLAEQLLRPDAWMPPVLARQALQALLGELTSHAVAHGWRPTDLVHVVSRRLGEGRIPEVVALVAAETDRHPLDRVAAAWRADLQSAGMPLPPDLREASGMQRGLELAALLAVLPEITVLLPRPGSTEQAQAGGGDPKLLAKVRALLAKAESTEFDEEAEALSAKAQELISRHALDRLLDEPAAAGDPPVARRLWLDAPYVFAKAMLVAAVADANRCRSVVSEDLGFCTVVGHEQDLASVDVLVTSLLVQAGTAMRRYGRQTDHRGTSRTRSFRQSFLVSYARRVRERLLAATEEAVQDSGRSGELVPLLRRGAEQVDAARDALFPELVTKAATINNAQGWAAGRAAADLARLDTGAQLREAAS